MLSFMLKKEKRRMNGQQSEAVLFLKKSENGWGITEIRV